MTQQRDGVGILSTRKKVECEVERSLRQMQSSTAPKRANCADAMGERVVRWGNGGRERRRECWVSMQ